MLPYELRFFFLSIVFYKLWGGLINASSGHFRRDVFVASCIALSHDQSCMHSPLYASSEENASNDSVRHEYAHEYENFSCSLMIY